jgi:hypothetical protein
MLWRFRHKLQLTRQPCLFTLFAVLYAKPFYNRVAFDVAVTLIHVVNEASESFWKMHEKFLWQEMKIYAKTIL